MLKKTLTIISVLALLHLFGCDDSTEHAKGTKKILIVGTSADFPPFEFIKNREIQGFDIELVKSVAEKLGYEVRFRDVTFHGLIPALKTGRIDLAVAALTATPGREREVDFSISYYNPSFAMLFKRNGPVPEMSKLKNKTIGVQSGTTMELFLKKRLKDDDFNIMSLPRTMQMVQDLKIGRLDGVLLEEAQAKEFSSKNELFEYYVYPDNEYGYSVAFKNGAKLKYEFDEVIMVMRDSGELADLKKKWFF